jgi:hypothetical protein
MNNNQQANSKRQFSSFAELVEANSAPYKNFTAYVEQEYWVIERSIRKGVPLNVLLGFLNKFYEIEGTIGAFKSALQRIRKGIKLEQEIARFHGVDVNQAVHAPVNGVSEAEYNRSHFAEPAYGQQPYGQPSYGFQPDYLNSGGFSNPFQGGPRL